MWNRKKITKKAHAGRGLETIWEMSAYVCARVAKGMNKRYEKRVNLPAWRNFETVFKLIELL